jgi:hypothetical protein
MLIPNNYHTINKSKVHGIAIGKRKIAGIKAYKPDFVELSNTVISLPSKLLESLTKQDKRKKKILSMLLYLNHNLGTIVLEPFRCVIL